MLASTHFSTLFLAVFSIHNNITAAAKHCVSRRHQWAILNYKKSSSITEMILSSTSCGVLWNYSNSHIRNEPYPIPSGKLYNISIENHMFLMCFFSWVNKRTKWPLVYQRVYLAFLAAFPASQPSQQQLLQPVHYICSPQVSQRSAVRHTAAHGTPVEGPLGSEETAPVLLLGRWCSWHAGISGRMGKIWKNMHHLNNKDVSIRVINMQYGHYRNFKRSTCAT